MDERTVGRLEHDIEDATAGLVARFRLPNLSFPKIL